MSTPIKLRDPNTQGRSYNYSFTFGGLATLVAALTLALTLFFVLGVLVGRGHRPEAALPPIARMMPTEPPANQATADILRADELQYGDNLGVKTTDATPSKAIDKVERKSPEKPKAEAEKKADKKDEKAAEKKDDKKDEKKATDKAAAEKLADKKSADAGKDAVRDAKESAAKESDKDAKRYDYVYQAGSFPDQEQAKAFLKKVKGAGLPKAVMETGTVGGKSWYRVVVPFQGTPVETRGLKAKLNSIGVSKIVMRSKKPL